MVFVIVWFRIPHTHSGGFIGFQNTRKFCLSHFGSSHFGSSSSRRCSRAVDSSFLLVLLHPRKTAHYAPQGMVFVPHARWMVQCDSWSPSTSGTVAAPPAPVGRMETRSVARDKVFSRAAQVAAQPPSHQSRRSAGCSTGEGHQVGGGIESLGRGRLRGSSSASSFEGGPPCRSGQASCSASRGMPSLHPTFTTVVGKAGRGTGEGARGVGRRAETNGQVAGRNGPVSPHNHSAGVRTHPGGTDPSSHGRARTSQESSERDGGRTRGGAQETVPFTVRPVPRLYRRARSDVAGVGRSARSARGTAQRSDHGNSDQSGEHSRPEFQSLQSFGLTDVPATSTGRSPREVARYGSRGRRVGEASHPGPTTSMFRRLRPRGRTRTRRSHSRGDPDEEERVVSLESSGEESLALVDGVESQAVQTAVDSSEGVTASSRGAVGWIDERSGAPTPGDVELVTSSCHCDPPAELLDCLEHDLCGKRATIGLHGRRVVLVPQDSDGTCKYRVVGAGDESVQHRAFRTRGTKSTIVIGLGQRESTSASARVHRRWGTQTSMRLDQTTILGRRVPTTSKMMERIGNQKSVTRSSSRANQRMNFHFGWWVLPRPEQHSDPSNQ